MLTYIVVIESSRPLPETILNALATQIDRFAIYSMYLRIPASFRQVPADTPTLAEVLAGTAVDAQRTPAYAVTAPGVRTVWLQSLDESLRCHVHVNLSAGPTAPLVIFHHGFSEMPYYSSWQRIFRQALPVPANTVLVQAPFHNHWRQPFAEAFASVTRVYQTFAGSLRLIDLVRREFEALGARYTVLAGTSWGGVTSMLYAAHFPGIRAVAPMLSSPNLAQVIWDAAEACNVSLSVSRADLDGWLDFTERCNCYDPARVFPLMGVHDEFFRPRNHWQGTPASPVYVPRAHVLSMNGDRHLREHIINVLDWAENHPLPGDSVEH